eukprot:GHVH01006693.1.p1 GENE.GHVH01006693.1~~GHVH01006693.1.p1  ORF type:complete len:358 (-),score=10.21 GHVH01006693.1:40-1113(-)
MLIYITRDEPIQVNYMKWLIWIMLSSGLIIYGIILLTYNELIGRTACTISATVVYFLLELSRGYASSQNYGVTAFYEPYGVNATMSVGISSGEGLSGLIPWLILLVYSEAKPDSTPFGDMVIMGVTMLVGALVCLVYYLLAVNAFQSKRRTTLMDIMTSMKRKRIEKIRKLELDSGRLKPISNFAKVKIASKGTKLVGFAAGLSLCGSLNIYPEVCPLGYAGISKVQEQMLLGIFTVCDPVLRLAGLSLQWLFKNRELRKSSYLLMVVVKTIVVVPIALVPYYDSENGWLDQYWQYCIFVVFLGFLHGSFVVLGVFCYMTHLPITPYTEISSGLITVYLVGGVAIGQTLFNLYPLFL